MMIVCIERDKYGDEPDAYYVVEKYPTDRDVAILRLRQMYNSELRYYLTRLDEHYTDEEVLKLLKQKSLRKEPNFVALGR